MAKNPAKTCSKNPLTPSECQQILNLRKTGSSLTKIAKEMHRGIRVISEFLKTAEANKSAPPESSQEFNDVSLEHRAIIKFLSKLRKDNQEIFEDIKKVYKKNYPSVEAIEYWAAQFKDGKKLVFPSVLPKKGRVKPKSQIVWAQSKAKATDIMKRSL